MALNLDDLDAQLDQAMELGDKWAEEDTLMPIEDKTAVTEKRGLRFAEHEGVIKEIDQPREAWSKKVDFLLSVIGFAVDLANIYRFPALCYSNGGGAFLIPYTLMLIFGGIPMFYMELCLGQYYKGGAMSTWAKICPVFKGIGYCVVAIAFYVALYYNVMIAWSLYLFFDCFADELPWLHCNNSWNTPLCKRSEKSEEGINGTDKLEPLSTNETVRYFSPTQEYFERSMLGLGEEINMGNLGNLRWELALSLLTVYAICYFALWKGVSSSGKAVWFTAVFPYIVLFMFLIRGVTLSGAGDGILFYLSPDISKLSDQKVWLDAATQVFFSLGPGFGVLMAFSSYNNFNNNVYYDALLTSAINCGTSFLAGFVVFAVLGHMAETTGMDISKVVDSGSGLVYFVYPEAISTLPGANIWSAFFFMMLMCLGLDSSFGGTEAIMTAMGDEFPVIRKKREKFLAILFFTYYVAGMFMCMQGGYYIVQLLDQMAAYYSILLVVSAEAIVVSWIYGVNRFSDDIKEMMGFRPGIFWRLCWKFITPAFIIALSIYGLSNWVPAVAPTSLGEYQYPPWGNIAGMIVAGSSLAFIPVIGLYQTFYYREDITGCCERFHALLRPMKVQEQVDEKAKKRKEKLEKKEKEQKEKEEQQAIAEGLYTDQLLDTNIPIEIVLDEEILTESNSKTSKKDPTKNPPEIQIQVATPRGPPQDYGAETNTNKVNNANANNEIKKSIMNKKTTDEYHAIYSAFYK